MVLALFILILDLFILIMLIVFAIIIGYYSTYLEEIFFIVKINLIIPIQNFESIHKFFYFIIVHIMNDKKIISIPKNQY